MWTWHWTRAIESAWTPYRTVLQSGSLQLYSKKLLKLCVHLVLGNRREMIEREALGLSAQLLTEMCLREAENACVKHRENSSRDVKWNEMNFIILCSEKLRASESCSEHKMYVCKSTETIGRMHLALQKLATRLLNRVELHEIRSWQQCLSVLL